MVTSTLGEAKYIEFPSLPSGAKHDDGSPVLNRHSATITRGHDFPGAQVRLPPASPIYLSFYMSIYGSIDLVRGC